MLCCTNCALFCKLCFIVQVVLCSKALGLTLKSEDEAREVCIWEYRDKFVFYMTNRYELIDFTWWLCLSVSRLWAEHIDEIFASFPWLENCTQSDLNKLTGASIWSFPKSICCAICNANVPEYLNSRETGNHRSLHWKHPLILWLSSDTIIWPSHMVIRW